MNSLMDYSIINQFRRAKIRLHQHAQKSKAKRLIKTMNSTQLKTFNGVIKTCKENPESIRYDKITGETLFFLKEQHVSITLKNNTISTHNHIKFGPPVWFTNEQFKYINQIIDIEAHRYRRRLKWEITDNTNKFLDEVFNSEENNSK